MAGLKNGVTRENFEAGLDANALEPLVHTINVQAGESIFILSGRIHAIGGGNLILEIQQNSDTTYRVYDWGRTGLDGKPRELHIEQSLQSSDFDDYEPETLKQIKGEQVLAQSDVFDLRKVDLDRGESIEFPEGAPRILSVVTGSLKDPESGQTIKRSENILLPSKHAFKFTSELDSVLLITENFN